jgi:hypothetical protein
MTVDEPVNLSFRYTEKDYLRAVRAHLRTRLRLPLDVLIVVALAALGAYEWRSQETHWYGVTAVTVSALFGLLLIAAFTAIPSLMFRREPKFRDDYSFTFSRVGIQFKTAHIDSELQWTMYTRALVDARSYILYYGARRFTVIPTRVFQNGEQQGIFERLVTQNIKEIIRRDKRAADRSPEQSTRKTR